MQTEGFRYLGEILMEPRGLRGTAGVRLLTIKTPGVIHLSPSGEGPQGVCHRYPLQRAPKKPRFGEGAPEHGRALRHGAIEYEPSRVSSKVFKFDQSFAYAKESIRLNAFSQIVK